MKASGDSSGGQEVTEIRAPFYSVSVLDITIAGPILLCLAGLDFVMHIALDLRKIRNRPQPAAQGWEFAIPSLAIGAAAVSTLLSFFLTLFLITLWSGIVNPGFIQVLIPVVDPPSAVWVCGLVVLSAGIVLHGWSRLVRWNMASSWQMTQDHRLVTSGPYARIRHPSYLSYMMCFVGFILMVPSIVALVLLLGFPGYYYVAKVEEKQLLHHFGEEYSRYVRQTGMFLPGIGPPRRKRYGIPRKDIGGT